MEIQAAANSLFSTLSEDDGKKVLTIASSSDNSKLLVYALPSIHDLFPKDHGGYPVIIVTSKTKRPL